MRSTWCTNNFSLIYEIIHFYEYVLPQKKSFFIHIHLHRRCLLRQKGLHPINTMAEKTKTCDNKIKSIEPSTLIPLLDYVSSWRSLYWTITQIQFKPHFNKKNLNHRVYWFSHLYKCWTSIFSLRFLITLAIPTCSIGNIQKFTMCWHY